MRYKRIERMKKGLRFEPMTFQSTGTAYRHKVESRTYHNPSQISILMTWLWLHSLRQLIFCGAYISRFAKIREQCENWASLKLRAIRYKNISEWSGGGGVTS